MIHLLYIIILYIIVYYFIISYNIYRSKVNKCHVIAYVILYNIIRWYYLGTWAIRKKLIWLINDTNTTHYSRAIIYVIIYMNT